GGGTDRRKASRLARELLQVIGWAVQLIALQAAGCADQHAAVLNPLPQSSKCLAAEIWRQDVYDLVFLQMLRGPLLRQYVVRRIDVRQRTSQHPHFRKCPRLVPQLAGTGMQVGDL